MITKGRLNTMEIPVVCLAPLMALVCILQIEGQELELRAVSAQSKDRVKVTIGKKAEESQRRRNILLSDTLISDKVGEFKFRLREVHKDRVVFLSIVQSSFVEMALNVYWTGYRKLKIKNFIFVCTDQKSVEIFASQGIDCTLIAGDVYYETGLANDTDVFWHKLSYRIRIAALALSFGYQVIVIDENIVMFKDPTLYFDTLKVDIASEQNGEDSYIGFYMARQTDVSTDVHLRALQLMEENPASRSDPLLRAIEEARQQGQLRWRKLNEASFPSGRAFFEDGKRMFKGDNPCVESSTCMAYLVHNDQMGSYEAKIHRLREYGLWNVDIEGYYSNPDQKFMLYDQPVTSDEDKREVERKALKVALELGVILNRKVILPMFNIFGCTSKACEIADDHCSVSCHFHIKTLRDHLGEDFREHVFLDHPLVPRSVKKSISPMIYFKENGQISIQGKADKLSVPISKGVLDVDEFIDVINETGLTKYSVLKFNVLEFDGVVQKQTSISFSHVDKGLVWSDYSQSIISDVPTRMEKKKITTPEKQRREEKKTDLDVIRKTKQIGDGQSVVFTDQISSLESSGQDSLGSSSVENRISEVSSGNDNSTNVDLPLSEAIEVRAGIDGDGVKVIYTTIVDFDHIELAINQYLTSYKRLNINNHLYVCVDEDSVRLMKTQGIECFPFTSEIPFTRSESLKVSDSFIRDYAKIKVSSVVLELGYQVVASDLNVILFKDPIDYLSTIKTDMVFLKDTMEGSVFYVARPGKRSLQIHRSVLTYMISNGEPKVQAVKNYMDILLMFAHQMAGQGELTRSFLDTKLFPSAEIYFERGGRVFSRDKNCLVEECDAFLVVNNNIVSLSAKIYRLRETGLWLYDGSSYYTSDEAKYILYGNPEDFGRMTGRKEREALETALKIGAILNRKVILPKFHCYGCDSGACRVAKVHCSLNAHFHVQSLTAKLPESIREHSFLENTLVPTNVKDSVSPIVYFDASKEIVLQIEEDSAVLKYNKDLQHDDIAKWFGSGPMSKYSILRFDSLYVRVNTADEITKNIQDAIVWSNYHQTSRDVERRVDDFSVLLY